MNRIMKEFAAAAVMGILVPAVLLGAAAAMAEVSRVYGERGEQPPQETGAVSSTPEVPVWVRMDTGPVSRSLEEYLVGVVLAEMPASFEYEALKAQAVVARTYTLRASATGGKHGDGSVCTDPGCCQAWLDPGEYLDRGGSREDLQRIRGAVEATAGLVLTYEGELIEATYFSCSGGSTEDALAVWGTDYPYLQATESPGEEHAAHYTDTVCFTPGEFADCLGRELTGDPAQWFGAVTYTQGGGVDTMHIGDICYRGTELRTLLGLRSTAFSVRVEEKISVTTRGYGHRVGMSQYGADAMAASGSGFAEILAYYYQGTLLTFYSGAAD